MTVGYMRGVATVSPLTFLVVLSRWRGSIWKSIVAEFFVWFMLYNIISLFYRIVLFGTTYGALFEDVIQEINLNLQKYGSMLNFVAAFYITYINNRWWWLYTQIPWPDNLCMLVSALMKSNGEAAFAKERQIRLAICRYWNLSFVLLLRDISVAAKKRFPDLESLKPSLATSEEIRLLRQADDMLGSGFQQTCLYSLPLDWIQKIIKQAADEGNFLRAHITSIHEEIMQTRQKMYNLLAQDFICAIPISLTQVAIATPVLYFITALFGKQYVVFLDQQIEIFNGTQADDIQMEYRMDYAIPFYTIFEFFIYVGWLKAAIAMLNPFGLDDDDFEVDYLIDRNNIYSRILLDDLFEVSPPPQDVEYMVLPHTFESAKNARNMNPMVGSVANVNVLLEPDSNFADKPATLSAGASQPLLISAPVATPMRKVINTVMGLRGGAQVNAAAAKPTEPAQQQGGQKAQIQAQSAQNQTPKSVKAQVLPAQNGSARAQGQPQQGTPLAQANQPPAKITTSNPKISPVTAPCGSSSPQPGTSLTQAETPVTVLSTQLSTVTGQTTAQPQGKPSTAISRTQSALSLQQQNQQKSQTTRAVQPAQSHSSQTSPAPKK